MDVDWSKVEAELLSLPILARAEAFSKFLTKAPDGLLLKVHNSLKQRKDHACVLMAAKHGRAALVHAFAASCKQRCKDTNEEGHNAIIVAMQQGSNSALLDATLKHCDVNQVGKDGAHTPMEWALLHESVATVSKLIQAGANINAKHKEEGTLLHFCVTARVDSEKIQLLLVQGADVHARNNLRHSPLMSAMADYPPCDMNTLLALIEAGSDLHVENSHGISLLALGVCNAVPTSVLELLVKRGCKVNENCECGLTALTLSLMNRDTNIALWLLDLGAKQGGFPQLNMNLLHMACLYACDVTVVERLIKLNATWVLEENHLGQTPLHSAVEGNASWQVAKLLMDSGVDVDAETNLGFTVKDLAVLSKFTNPELKQTILQSDQGFVSQFNVERMSISWLTRALQSDLMQGNGPMERQAKLVMHGAEVNDSATATGESPFMTVIISMPQPLPTVNYMIQAGGDVNVVNKHGVSSLHFAAMHHVHPEVVRLLIRAGGDCDLPMSGTKDTPLMAACKTNASRELAVLLLAHQRTNRLNGMAMEVAKKSSPVLYTLIKNLNSPQVQAELAANRIEFDSYPAFTFSFCTACRRQQPNNVLFACSGCLLVSYCDEECQRRHFYMHKRVCRAVRKTKNWINSLE
ncbi:hypothetical protein BASA81_002320 [Batrachochytrium salamandrivorans]|nr:hypothetical protein BASA81_002320 [Batrachochytrium salamandrivorans]